MCTIFIDISYHWRSEHVSPFLSFPRPRIIIFVEPSLWFANFETDCCFLQLHLTRAYLTLGQPCSDLHRLVDRFLFLFQFYLYYWTQLMFTKSTLLRTNLMNPMHSHDYTTSIHAVPHPLSQTSASQHSFFHSVSLASTYCSAELCSSKH